MHGSPTLAIVGCGTMGEAIVAGLIGGGQVTPERIVVTARRPARLDALARKYGVRTDTDNVAAVADADIVVLCLKPQGVVSLVADPRFAGAVAHKVVVSVAAGVALSRLDAALPEAHVLRAMPNTPCTIRRGMTVISRGAGVNDAQASAVLEIFEAVGDAIELDDRHMDAVTSLNGSGPAFVYVMLESMADGGVMMGLPRDVALTMAARVFEGAAAMVVEKNAHPAALKDEVTTPAGCTIAGLLTMEDGRIRSVLARTIQEATKVAAGLGD